MSDAEKEFALIEMLRRYNRYGITSLTSGAGNQESVKMYRQMADKKVLTARICQNIELPVGKTITKESIGDQIKKYPWKTGDGDEWVRIGPLKVFLDGGILTGTAYMKEPWGIKAVKIFGVADPEYKGVLTLTREELTDIVSVANQYNWSFTAHATGEAAVELLLDVYADVNKEKPINEKRFSVIHGNFFNQKVT